MNGDGHEAHDDAVLRFVERFGLLLAEAGTPRMPARVFACLLADDDGRMTAGELAARLQVSPAAISGAVRYLTQVRLIERHREPGRRTDDYRLAGDTWSELFAHRMTLVTAWEDAMAEGAALLGPDTPAGRRLRHNQAFFAFVRDEVEGMMARWQKRKAELAD